MFCRFCGNEINDDAQFCPKCGNSLNNAPAPAGCGSEREQLLKRFDECSELIDAITRQEDIVEQQQNKVDALEPKTKPKSLIKFGLLGFVIALLLSLSLPKGAAGDIAALCIIGGPVIIGIILMNKYKVDLSKEAETLAQYKQVLEGFKNDPKLDWLPESIRFGLGLERVRANLINMRANTLTESINVFVEDIHRSVVEAASAETLAAAQRAESAAKSAAFWSRV